MIAKETVLNKMLQEIQLAQTNMHDDRVMIEHVKNIQLLSELILESSVAMKDHQVEKVVNEQAKVDAVQTMVTPDAPSTEDDGTSIFEF